MTENKSSTTESRILELKGDLTIAEVAAVRESILSELSNQNGSILIDVTGVEAIDSAGLQLVIASQRSGAKLSSIPDVLQRAAAVLGLTDAFAPIQTEVN